MLWDILCIYGYILIWLFSQWGTSEICFIFDIYRIINTECHQQAISHQILPHLKLTNYWLIFEIVLI